MIEGPRRNVDPGRGPKADGTGLDAARVRRALTAALDHVTPRQAGLDYRVVGTAAAGSAIPADRQQESLDQLSGGATTP